MYKDALKALERAEAIIEKNYTLTGEVKLLPLALQNVYKAAEYAWKETRKKEKPPFLKQLQNIIQKKKESPVEFQRQKKVIFCSEKLKTTSIDEETVKQFVKKTREYIEKCKKKTKHEKN